MIKVQKWRTDQRFLGFNETVREGEILSWLQQDATRDPSGDGNVQYLDCIKVSVLVMILLLPTSTRCYHWEKGRKTIGDLLVLFLFKILNLFYFLLKVSDKLYFFKEREEAFLSFFLFFFNFLFCWHRVLVVACGIQFPDQGSNRGLLHWEHRVLATGLPGKSVVQLLKQGIL